mgnify:CR=1 FL=1
MFEGLVKAIFGSQHERDIKAMLPILLKVNEKEAWAASLPSDEFASQTQKFKERIKNGESFTELCNQYGEDSTMLNNPDGTYFARGMTDAAVEEASFSLGINEISGVVDGSNGYYIIKRQPLDAEYINTNMETLKYYYQQALFSDELEEIIDGLSFEFGEIYPQISVFNMGWAV